VILQEVLAEQPGTNPGAIMKSIVKWIACAWLGASMGCNATASQPPPASASGIGSPQSDFAAYKTFSLAPANPPADGYEVTPRSLEVQRRLAALVTAALEKRGYSEALQDADLLVKVSAGSGEATGDKTQRGNPEEPMPAGFIGIDAYDSRTGVTVWHGSGQAELKQQEPIEDALLERGVERILADFPVRQRVATAGN
jgi:hypothetical protein